MDGYTMGDPSIADRNHQAALARRLITSMSKAQSGSSGDSSQAYPQYPSGGMEIDNRWTAKDLLSTLMANGMGAGDKRRLFMGTLDAYTGPNADALIGPYGRAGYMEQRKAMNFSPAENIANSMDHAYSVNDHSAAQSQLAARLQAAMANAQANQAFDMQMKQRATPSWMEQMQMAMEQDKWNKQKELMSKKESRDEEKMRIAGILARIVARRTGSGV